MRLYLAVFFIFIGATFSGAEFLSVTEDSLEIRDSPNLYISQVVLVVPQYYPLSIVSAADDYYKVSDFLGREGWVEKGAVTSADTVVVKTGIANVRSGSGIGHEILFRANQGVVFRVLEEKSDWLKVEHASGKKGWIYEDLVWGKRLGADF